MNGHRRWEIGDVVYRLRVLLMTAAIFGLMSVLLPGVFPTWFNIGNMLRATSTDAFAAVAFTLVLLMGHLDLSVGAAMGVGGACVMYLQPALGWPGTILAVSCIGGGIGLVNGILVAKVRINSFIVTLGMMTILVGLTRIILGGGSVSLKDADEGMRVVEVLDPMMPWSPRVLMVFLPVVAVELFLRRTRAGRNLFLIGGNAEAAWHAGIAVDRHVIGVFVLSGVLSTMGGVVTALGQNTAMPNLGAKTLMLVVAAVIVGGTSMAGGRGSAVMSVVALFMLNCLTNGLSYLGASKSVKLVSQGAVLAAVILYDAVRTSRLETIRGQRRELLKEFDSLQEERTEDEEMTHRKKDITLAVVCISAVACVAIVAIVAMWTYAVYHASPGGRAGGSVSPPQDFDPLALKATDGQPLVWIDHSPLEAPPRPDDPASLPRDDLLHWYDYVYAGWDTPKLPMPDSPGDGPRGKKVISLQYMDHPYWTGYRNGMQRLADRYGMELVMMEAGNDNKLQMDQVQQAIAGRPDMVIITPVDAKGAVPMLKKLHDAGIPTIASNLLPVDEGHRYAITWTGPDDWGQMRMLAREFARKMKGAGGYCIVRHVAGTSCFLSRTWSVVSELKKIAPTMTCLDMQTTDLDAEKTKRQVSAWLDEFGDRLKGIVSADDSKAQIGIVEALKEAGRNDVVCVSAGSSGTGLDFIKKGRLHAVTYQSAEADGALPIEIAARWFRGETIDRPIFYLRKIIITRENVEDFYPPQW